MSSTSGGSATYSCSPHRLGTCPLPHPPEPLSVHEGRRSPENPAPRARRERHGEGPAVAGRRRTIPDRFDRSARAGGLPGQCDHRPEQRRCSATWPRLTESCVSSSRVIRRTKRSAESGGYMERLCRTIENAAPRRHRSLRASHRARRRRLSSSPRRQRRPIRQPPGPYLRRLRWAADQSALP